MVDSGELLKIAEQFRAMNPPWFKAISEAAIRIRELEVVEQARRIAEIHELELRQIHKEDRAYIHELETELDRYQRCYWANEGEYEALTAKVAKLREALEKIIAELEESPPGVADPYIVACQRIARAALQKDQGE